jgi:hypothetical protein
VVEHRLSGNPPGEPLDDGADPGRAEILVKLAPTDDALVGRQFEEVIIPPAGIAARPLTFIGASSRIGVPG